MPTPAQLTQRKEALRRAQEGGSEANYEAIMEGFLGKGIEEEEILPRENVFTYNAWLAKGRRVRRGEHGVRIETFVPAKKADESGEEKRFKLRRFVTVFHISQTEKVSKNGEEEE